MALNSLSDVPKFCQNLNFGWTKVEIKCFLTVYLITMGDCNVMKMIITCSRMTGQLFDAILQRLLKPDVDTDLSK